MPKLKLLWRSGTSQAPKRTREDVLASSDATPESRKRQKVMDAGQDIDKKDPDENFLLAPRGSVPQAELEDIDNPEDTPEIDALDRHPDDTKAMPMGDVVGQPEMSVVPDVTLDVSPPDQLINGPTELVVDAPAPIVPGIELGPSVAQARFVPPQTLEQKQETLESAEALPSVKANGAKDIGADGFGALVSEGRVGKDEPLADEVSGSSSSAESSPDGPRVGGSKFTSKKLDHASIPKIDENETLDPDRPNLVNASRHPFKQAGLFRNHDMLVKRSKLIDKAYNDRARVMKAAQQTLATRDLSYYRYNAATQGVAMSQMPMNSSNYLQSGNMFSEYQQYGANPLQNVFGPSPYVNEKLIGRFR